MGTWLFGCIMNCAISVVVRLYWKEVYFSIRNFVFMRLRADKKFMFEIYLSSKTSERKFCSLNYVTISDYLLLKRWNWMTPGCRSPIQKICGQRWTVVNLIQLALSSKISSSKFLPENRSERGGFSCAASKQELRVLRKIDHNSRKSKYKIWSFGVRDNWPSNANTGKIINMCRNQKYGSYICAGLSCSLFWGNSLKLNDKFDMR